MQRFGVQHFSEDFRTLEIDLVKVSFLASNSSSPMSIFDEYCFLCSDSEILKPGADSATPMDESYPRCRCGCDGAIIGRIDYHQLARRFG